MKKFFICVFCFLPVLAFAQFPPSGHEPWLRCQMYPDSVFQEAVIYRKIANTSVTYAIGGRNNSEQPFKNYFAPDVPILKKDLANDIPPDLVLRGENCDFERGKLHVGYAYIPNDLRLFTIWSYSYVQTDSGCIEEQGEFQFHFSDEAESCTEI